MPVVNAKAMTITTKIVFMTLAALKAMERACQNRPTGL
jgi:hypothetical protein